MDNAWLFKLSVLIAGLAVGAGAAQAARDGQLDPGFGTQGKSVLAFPGDLYLSPAGIVDLAVLPDGRIIVAATVTNADGDDDFAAIRLDADGGLDTTFGSNGGRRVGFDRAGSSLDDRLVGLAIQPDGKILLSGVADGAPASEGQDMAIARLNANGSLDNSFGSGGRVTVPFNLGPAGWRDDIGNRIDLQHDGRILIVGSAHGADGEFDIAVVRLNANGQRDTGFDGDGRVTLDFGPDHESAQGTMVRQLADQAHLLVLGQTEGRLPGDLLTYDFALARLNLDGSLDTGFGNGGKVAFDFAVGGHFRDGAYDFVELSDGKLMVCGVAEANLPNNSDMACMRFLADGSPDPDFAAVIVPFDRGGELFDAAMRMRRDAAGRFLLTGMVTSSAGNFDFGLARILADGDADPFFGEGGIVTHNSCSPVCLPSEFSNISTSLDIQPDGRIVVAGWVANSQSHYRFQVMRLLGDVIFSHGFEP